jgi:hypothetical protein
MSFSWGIWNKSRINQEKSRKIKKIKNWELSLDLKLAVFPKI